MWITYLLLFICILFGVSFSIFYEGPWNGFVIKAIVGLGLFVLYLIYVITTSRYKKRSEDDPVGTVYYKSDVNGFKYQIRKGEADLEGFIGINFDEKEDLLKRAGKLFMRGVYDNKGYFWYKCTEGTSIREVDDLIEEAAYMLSSRDKVFYMTHCLSKPKEK